MSIVSADGQYLHREIHRLATLVGEVVEITPWTEDRFRMGEEGFVEMWLSPPKYGHSGWGSLCGAYMDKYEQRIRVQHQFAPLPTKGEE